MYCYVLIEEKISINDFFSYPNERLEINSTFIKNLKVSTKVEQHLPYYPTVGEPALFSFPEQAFHSNDPKVELTGFPSRRSKILFERKKLFSELHRFPF